MLKSRKKTPWKIIFTNRKFIIIFSVLSLYFTFCQSAGAVYVYKGKIEPGKTTKEKTAEVLGEPEEEIISLTYKYESSESGIDSFFITYKEVESKMVVDKMEVIFSKPYKNEALRKTMKFPEPISKKVNSYGKYQEYFGSKYSVIFTHKNKSPKSGVVSMSILSRDQFVSLEKGADVINEPESIIADHTERQQTTETADPERSNEIEVAKLTLEAKQHLQQGMIYVSLAKANPKTKDENYKNALLEFSNAIKIYPKYAEAYSDRGVVYMQQKKYNKAEEDLKKAAELKPKDPIILYNLAALYSLEKKNDFALDYLDKALENGFNNFDALKPEGKDSDPDLVNLRKDPEFKKVLEKHKVFIVK